MVSGWCLSGIWRRYAGVPLGSAGLGGALVALFFSLLPCATSQGYSLRFPERLRAAHIDGLLMPAIVSTLQEENEALKQKLALMQRRVCTLLARNAKLETLLCSKSPRSSDGSPSSRAECSLNDVSDDALLHIVHLLLEAHDVISIARLRRCCKVGVGLLCASVKISDGLGYRLSWPSEQQTFFCSDHLASGGPAWLASSKLPSSGRVTWSITIHHETTFFDVWGEHLIGVCNEDSTWAWGAAPQLRKVGEISIWNAWFCQAYPRGAEPEVRLSLCHAGDTPEPSKT